MSKRTLRHWTEYVKLRDKYPRARAILRCIRAGESRQDDQAYFIRWGGIGRPPKFFDDLSQHPRILEPGPKGPSSAAGAYQITATTYDDFAPRIGVTGFSRDEQDALALAICEEEGALEKVLEGDFRGAVEVLGGRWSSFPSNTDGQRTQTWEKLAAAWVAYGGEQAGDGAPPEVTDVPPVADEGEKMPLPAIIGAVATFGPALVQMIPVLAPLFDRKAETPEKLAAATKALEVVVKTTGAVNEQDALQKMQADPALVTKAKQAVLTDETIMPLLVISPAGIEKAAERNIQLIQSADVWWKLVLNPVLIVTVLVLPLVYMLVWAMLPHLEKVSADVIAQTVGTVIGLVLGGIMGFWMGQTYQNMREKQRTTDVQLQGEVK